MTKTQAFGFAYDALVHEMEMMEEALGCEYEMGEVVQEQQWMVDELRETADWKELNAAAKLLHKMIMEG